ncbi:MAG: hypothetical protein LLF78_04700 [Synergistaceae bacterium]|nr:hypothetical protein [Synergistaceae bacterium]
MERTLLLFEPDAPCWDEETFVLAGESPETVSYLLDRGYIVRAGHGYVLTEEGTAKRLEMAEEYYISAEKIPPFDPDLSLWNNRLYLLMEKAFLGQFGIKEYSVNEEFPVVPGLSAKELYSVKDGQIEYTWQRHPQIQSFLSAFPNWGVGSRSLMPPGEKELIKWAAVNRMSSDTVRFNVVLRSRYDFELYRKQAPYPSDKFRLKDADRLFFYRITEDNIDDFYETLGKMHIFLLGQRRVYIPGYADIDSHEQENWTMMVLVADAERTLGSISKRLSAHGKALIEPANPLFIIGTSIERLREQNKPEDTVYDWFCDRTVHIARPDI